SSPVGRARPALASRLALEHAPGLVRPAGHRSALPGSAASAHAEGLAPRSHRRERAGRAQPCLLMPRAPPWAGFGAGSSSGWFGDEGLDVVPVVFVVFVFVVFEVGEVEVVVSGLEVAVVPGLVGDLDRAV